MEGKRRDTGIPEFESIEKEKEYWEARGPLAEGHKGRINKPKPAQRRSSFLAVRMTGEELTHLRDMAAKQGLGTSTFARIVLTSIIKHQSRLPRYITLDQLKEMFENSLPEPVKNKANALAKDAAIGNSDKPSFLLIDSSQMKKSEEIMWSIFTALLSVAGVQVITPENEEYENIRDVIKSKA